MVSIICRINGCDKEAKANGLCWKHYAQLRRHDAISLEENHSRKGECKVPGCHSKIKARGLCNKHYKQYKKAGKLPSRKYIK